MDDTKLLDPTTTITPNNTNDNDEEYYTEEEEVEVAKILLNLPNLIQCNPASFTNPNLLDGFPTWSSKGRRSVLDNPPPSSPPPSGSHIIPKEQTAALSPSTPLSFEAAAAADDNDIDDHHQVATHPNKRSKITVEEGWLSKFNEFVQTNRTLKEQLKNVTDYYNQLKSQNSELKAIKKRMRRQKLKDGNKKHVNECNSNNDEKVAAKSTSTANVAAVNDQLHAALSTSTQLQHPTPSDDPSRRGVIINHPIQQQAPQAQQALQQLGQAQHVHAPCPRGFDLNVPAQQEYPAVLVGQGHAVPAFEQPQLSELRMQHQKLMREADEKRSKMNRLFRMESQRLKRQRA